MRMLPRVLAMIGCFVLGTIVSLEFGHWAKYGHLVWYGLHVDAVTRDYDVGFPGQTKLYSPEVTNFSLLPVRLPACQSRGYFTAPSNYYAFALQSYNDQSKSWETRFTRDFEYCVSSETHESCVVSTYLLPGSSFGMIGYTLGPIDGCYKNDLARWVVFSEVSPTVNWDTAIVSAPFSIEE